MSSCFLKALDLVENLGICGEFGSIDRIVNPGVAAEAISHRDDSVVERHVVAIEVGPIALNDERRDGSGRPGDSRRAATA